MSKRKTLSNILVVQLFLIVLFMGVAVAAPPNSIPGVGPKFVPGELIVKFKPGISVQEIDAINASHGTSVLSVNPIARFMRLRIHGSDRAVRQMVRKYQDSGKVEYAEPNYIVHNTQVPNDIGFMLLWGLDNTGLLGGTPGADINAPDAWDIQTGNSSVVVAVIDTGVDYNHQDLSANIWTNPGEIPGNGLDDDENGFIDDVRGWVFLGDDNDPTDDNSHGTHVAGTMAAVGNNEIGVVGVNWTARIMPLKFLNANGSGNVVDAIAAIQYASTMGAKIMSNSWGGAGFSQSLKNAIVAADAAGALFVAAAGNDGANNDISPFYPSSYDVPNIIRVAATDHFDELAGFSNYGPSSVDLGAPGVDILSTTPNDEYDYKGGTSMAAPHVSGVAALIMAEFPALTHDEIKERMLNAVDPLPSLKGLVSTGGRLNAYNALLGVVPPPLPPPTIVFEDDMESGINGWTVSGGTSLWHQSNNNFVSYNTSWYYGIEGVFNYDTGGINLGSITSPPIDLTGFTGSALIFNHFLDTEELFPFDMALVRISNDGGASFTDVFTRLTTDGVFVQENLNISAFDGDIIQIQFFFDTVDTVYNHYEGWYVDDVMVTGHIPGPPLNIPPVADAGPDQTLSDVDGDGSESVTLDGSGSFDSDGVIVAYEWKEGETVLGTTAIITDSFAVGSHTVTLTVTDNGGATDTDTVLIIVNEALATIHISNIDITLLKKGRKYNVRGLVSIVDDTGRPIQGSTVTGEWTLNEYFVKEASKETNKKGVARLSPGKVSVQSGDTLTITIINVSKEGFTYDPTENVETSDWAIVP